MAAVAPLGNRAKALVQLSGPGSSPAGRSRGPAGGARLGKPGVGSKPAVVGKLGVISEEAGPVEAVVQAINDARLKAIPTRDMTEMIVVSADVGGLLKRYGLEIRGALQLARLKLSGPGGQPPADPIKQMALRGLGHTAKLIAETEKQAGVAEFGFGAKCQGGRSWRRGRDSNPRKGKPCT